MIRSIPTIASLAALRVAFAALDAGARAANTLALLRDARRVERAARAAEREAARFERFAQAPEPCPRCAKIDHLCGRKFSAFTFEEAIEKAEEWRSQARESAKYRDIGIAMRSDMERLRETLAEAIAQRDEAETLRKLACQDRDAADALRRRLCADAAQNLSAAQAVIADMRRELDEARSALRDAEHREELARTRLRAWERERDVCVAELRRALASAQEERDSAMAVADGRQGVIDRMAERLGARDGETPPMAAERVVRERAEARSERDEAAKKLDELNTGGVVATLRTDRERLRALDAALGSDGAPQLCIHAMLRMLDAVEGETLTAAVARVSRRAEQLHAVLRQARAWVHAAPFAPATEWERRVSVLDEALGQAVSRG